MNTIDEILIEYEKLLKKDIVITLENGDKLTLIFKKEFFPHLIGLHYLEDITILKALKEKKARAGLIYNQLKNQTITDAQIKNSRFFPKIQDRFNNFISIENVIFNKIIFNFDNSKALSKITADILLYKSHNNTGLHLLIKNKKAETYIPVTFIVQSNDQYIKNQLQLDVHSVEIVEHNKNKENSKPEIKLGKSNIFN